MKQIKSQMSSSASSSSASSSAPAASSSTDEVNMTEVGIRTMITALNQAQARGAFTLEEACTVMKAIQVFVKNTTPGTSPIIQAGQSLL